MSTIARGDRGEIEQPRLLGHASVKDYLEQQIAQLVLQRGVVAAGDRIGDLVGLFDRIGRDRREILFAVPRAAMLGVAQPSHDRQQIVKGRGHVPATRSDEALLQKETLSESPCGIAIAFSS